MTLSRRAEVAVIGAIIAVTLIRVAATHGVFSPTFDEGGHIAAGHEYLKNGTYRLDPQHPPLARIFFALPFLDRPYSRESNTIVYGNELLDSGGNLRKNIAHARRGNLLFLLIACAGVALWARHLFGTAGGIASLIAFASLPPVLAHAGLATTDMAGVAALPFALLALTLFLDRPTWPRTIALGVAFGLGLVCKFSFLPFFAVSAIALFIIKRRVPLFRGAVAMLLGFVVVWGVYRFSVAPMSVDAEGHELARIVLHSPRVAELTVPAPMFWTGLLRVKAHDHDGHDAFLLGRFSTRGWWYYFPVAIAVKTPLPFLALAIAGAVLLARRRAALELHAATLLILAIAMSSSINIGVRHVLPIYVPMALLAGYGAVTLAASRARVAVAVLSAWLVGGSLLAHPDYLPWMNALTFGHPERVLVDSNLDWGQDVFRLASECRKRHVTALATDLFGTTDPVAAGLPPVTTRHLSWYQGADVWTAIGETTLQEARAQQPVAFEWLTVGRDFIRVGKGIRLYDGRRAMILLPLAGTAQPIGGAGRTWWRVEQSVTNGGPGPVRMTMSSCAPETPCILTLAPGESASLAGVDPASTPFTTVDVPASSADALTFTTVVRRSDDPSYAVRIPAVHERALTAGRSEIDAVPLRGANLRAYVFGSSALTLHVLAPGGRELASANIVSMEPGYWKSGDLQAMFPNVIAPRVILRIDTAPAARVWAFVIRDRQVLLPRSGT